MHTIRIETIIHAPIQRCFDLARSIEAHLESTQRTDERVTAGPVSGLLEPGQDITWEARHLGLRQQLTSCITRFDPPGFFQDRMVQGRFKSFEHDHLFTVVKPTVTRMVDVLRIEAPGGLLGKAAERWLLGPHLARFLTQRGCSLKKIAESDQWRGFLSGSQGGAQ
jgi:ligand-binding SRPBCC domain-containing protein